MRILIINGPSLNLLGKREESIYGNISFETYLEKLKEDFAGIDFEYFQSNIEGELIDKLHASINNGNGIVLNAGGYTHTSIAIADAIAAIKVPVIEVHISNIFAREVERHTTLISKNCIGSISGFGLFSYNLAIEYFLKQLK